MMLGRMRHFLDAWIDALAQAIGAVVDRVRGRREPLIAVFEGDSWQVSDERGLAVATVPAAATGALPWMERRDIRAILPETRMFRASLPPMPEESREFLAAIVDLRVDRIAPWNREDRLTGFRVQAIDGRQIAVDVAVTARLFADALVDAAVRNEARSLSIVGTDEEGVPIDVPLPDAAIRQRGLRRIAGLGLATLLLCVVAAAGLLVWQSFEIEQQRQLTEDQISARMAVIRKADAAAKAGGAAEQDPLDKKKQAGPLAVITVEALSRLLPDDTYLVSLRYEGATVRIAGFTRSFQQLVPMLVASPYFSDASFSEPIERQPDGTDRFAIELVLRPVARIEVL